MQVTTDPMDGMVDTYGLHGEQDTREMPTYPFLLYASSLSNMIISSLRVDILRPPSCNNCHLADALEVHRLSKMDMTWMKGPFWRRKNDTFFKVLSLHCACALVDPDRIPAGLHPRPNATHTYDYERMCLLVHRME